jgi:sensor c-di-GMP phosphodiesterase-like protein
MRRLPGRLLDRLTAIGTPNPRDGGPSLRATLFGLVLGIAGGAIAALAATSSAFFHMVPADMELARSSAVARMIVQDSEIRRTFESLSNIEGMPCSAPYLAEMRSIVLRSYSVRDAAYRQGDEVLCSSGAGQVRVSIPQFGPPVFRAANGIQIWRNIELPSAPGIESTILLWGRFSLMVAPGPVESNAGTPISTVMVNPLSGAVTTINGPQVNLSAADLLAGKPMRIGLRRISSECVGKLVMCQVQEVGPREIWREYNIEIILLALAGSALGASLAFMCMAMLRKRAAFDSRLRRGLARGEVTLVYQPIIDLGTGKIVAVESLMRWTAPSQGSIPPAEFIAGAEKSSLITDLTCFALETASRDLRDELLSPSGLVVSINVVPRDLADPRFLEALEMHVIGAGISPNRIALELTERQPIDTAEARAAIKALHAKGYRISIDDFGTGNSNLSYLGDLSITAIKMDMIFTQSVGTDNIRSRLIPSILGMARDLGATMVVEGIETAAQEEYFKAAGVRFAQGWRYSRAVSAEEFKAMVSVGRLPAGAEVKTETSSPDHRRPPAVASA